MRLLLARKRMSSKANSCNWRWVWMSPCWTWRSNLPTLGNSSCWTFSSKHTIHREWIHLPTKKTTALAPIDDNTKDFPRWSSYRKLMFLPATLHPFSSTKMCLITLHFTCLLFLSSAATYINHNPSCLLTGMNFFLFYFQHFHSSVPAISHNSFWPAWWLFFYTVL